MHGRVVEMTLEFEGVVIARACCRNDIGIRGRRNCMGV